jgi:uracil phosphoribosyltransferase
MPIQLLDHPLAAHLLAGLRDRETPPERFRQMSKSLTTLLVLQATYGIRTARKTVRTPLAPADAQVLDQPLAVVPVLRAGLGMLEPVLELFPDVAVGYIGLERHEDTAIARSYYSKLPNLNGRFTLCVDPMLATGGSAAQAIGLIKSSGAHTVMMVCVVAAPEGVRRVEEAHPEVQIVTAALDTGLDERKYIVPGLGDFGDRLFGTP